MPNVQSLTELPPNPDPASAEPMSRSRATLISIKDTIRRDQRGSDRASEKPSERQKWKLGILADEKTDEVPGTVVLLSKYSTRNIPLGLQHEETRGRTTRRGSGSGSISAEANRRRSVSNKKKTPDGKVILVPQPEDSLNDPLNWPSWRRDTALLSLGFYCMLGGGMTPILAAGFGDVANTFNVTIPQVALTTGLYMMGMGMGSVFFSPTAILFGKRPVYLLGALLFVLTSIWCATAPSYPHLAAARVFQGFAVSPVECLPSATIAEIYFLHERAFRLGIYTLLLLGGKNLVPLASAVVIQALSWRWVFWIVTIIVGLGAILLFLFVPETFWDRTPRPRALHHRSHSVRRSVSRKSTAGRHSAFTDVKPFRSASMASTRTSDQIRYVAEDQEKIQKFQHPDTDGTRENASELRLRDLPRPPHTTVALSSPEHGSRFREDDSALPTLHNVNSPYYSELERNDSYMSSKGQPRQTNGPLHEKVESGTQDCLSEKTQLSKDSEPSGLNATSSNNTNAPHNDQLASDMPGLMSYTTGLREAPPKPWLKTLNPWNGRLSQASWWRAAIRPFILFAYPAVLWSAMVYSLSVGWLIVLSESVAVIYRNRESYNFSALGVGLVYMSPFIGGILGTAVAGRVSDILVRFMARRNDGIYEPEYRLLMALPIALTTAAGLMGFGWSAEERDAWIVPTIFFGITSFGCCLGSTTAITFCVDSYRQYAGEALVTLNFSKNIFHGLVWSLFFPRWLESSGSKDVFLTIGGIQVACLLLTIPMYIYGKRARMWTVRKGLMSKF